MLPGIRCSSTQVARVIWIECMRGGSRQNDGLETGSTGGYYYSKAARVCRDPPGMRSIHMTRATCVDGHVPLGLVRPRDSKRDTAPRTCAEPCTCGSTRRSAWRVQSWGRPAPQGGASPRTAPWPRAWRRLTGLRYPAIAVDQHTRQHHAVSAPFPCRGAITL